jgi:hypothetical protein
MVYTFQRPILVVFLLLISLGALASCTQSNTAAPLQPVEPRFMETRMDNAMPTIIPGQVYSVGEEDEKIEVKGADVLKLLSELKAAKKLDKETPFYTWTDYGMLQVESPSSKVKVPLLLFPPFLFSSHTLPRYPLLSLFPSFPSFLPPPPPPSPYLAHCLRWHVQGKVDKGEMDYFTDIAREEKLSNAGAGIYFSDETKSSDHFGFCAVQFNVAADTAYWDESIARRVLGRGTEITNRQKVGLGRLINFIDHFTDYRGGKWHATHSLGVVQNCELAFEVSFARMWSTNIYEFMEEIRRLPSEIKGKVSNEVQQLWDHTSGYFYSLYTLMYYYDPVSFVRAVHINPNDPWAVFERQNFDPFLNGRSKLFQRVLLQKEDLDIVMPNGKCDRAYAGYEMCHYKFQKFPMNDVWAKKMVDELLPLVYHTLSGTGIKYRNFGIRAGGDKENRTFDAWAEQCDAMAENDYLETHCHKNPKEKESPYLCYYRYPGADSYEGLINTLKPRNPKLVERLQEDPVGPDADKLTNDLIQELLLEMFERLSNKPIGNGKIYPVNERKEDAEEHPYRGGDTSLPGVIQAMIDLVSIHPCGDFNGRSTRGFAHLAAISGAMPCPVMALYDFDITASSTHLVKFVDQTTIIYEQIQREMIKHVWEKVEKKERIGLTNGMSAVGNEFMDIFKPFAVFGADPPTKWSRKYDRLIEKRLWVDMMDTMGGIKWKQWREAESKSFPE